MNREFVNTYMQEKNIPSGYLKTWYNFESGIATGSAGLIYNQVYATGNHFFDPANYDGSLKSGVMAGISIATDTELFPSSRFSGDFNYTEMVQISDNINYNNWTTFFDITTSNQQNLTGQTKILLSSMKNSGDTSGFHIGLNGYNHPFITYASTDGNQYTHTFSREASNRSLLSFSFNSDGKSLRIGKHSPREKYSESFVTKSLNPSKNWTIGGFKDYLDNETPGNEIRAFNGRMDHFMLFSPSLKSSSPENFSDFLFNISYSLICRKI